MEASFVEPKQKCAGTPSIKSVGVVISPPPGDRINASRDKEGKTADED